MGLTDRAIFSTEQSSGDTCTSDVLAGVGRSIGIVCGIYFVSLHQIRRIPNSKVQSPRLQKKLSL